MMTRTSKPGLKRLILYISILLTTLPVFSENSEAWVIAAEKFQYAKGYNENAVSDASAEMFPMTILEKLNRNIVRNVLPDERMERQNYQLRIERQSLYLQLSAEYKKRDALFLEYSSDKVLASKIKEREIEIKKIQKKIDDNLATLRQNIEKSQEDMNKVYSSKIENRNAGKSELEIIQNFFHDIFIKNESVITEENIEIYRKDFSALYKPSVENPDIHSTAFEKEIVGAKINTYLKGTISGFGDYVSVTVDLYIFPGAKKIGSVTELGTIQEADLITSSIANQIIPLLTNAMPVVVNFQMNPFKAAAKAQLYIDDILQSTETDTILLESGVHSIQFISEGYRTAGTSYYFEGNKTYKIEIDFKEQMDGYLQLKLMSPVTGDFLANGESAVKVDASTSQIKINGNRILGEFITENGENAFFYLPEKMVTDKNIVNIKPKLYDKEQYIDTRRKWMYGSYTALMISLIPTFYTTGQLENEIRLFKNRQVTYDEARRYEIASNVCTGLTIGCGVFFVYELIRYLIAANGVLPQTVKQGNVNDYVLSSPVIVEKNEVEEIEKIEEIEEEILK